ncbi:MAG: endonuclease/exonuclease/phosphatase family protein [Acidimicrobiia bacterium]
MTIAWRRLAWLVAVAAIGAAACSSDGGSGDAGEEPSEPRAAPVRVATLNLLHGLFCPDETDSCQAPDRVQIFTELVEAADCPDLIGLQEIGERLEELLPDAVAAMCDGEYEIAWEPSVNSVDRQMVLARRPIVDQGHLDIANFPWEAYWVRIESDQGPVDFLTAHFASSSNNPPCDAEICPAVCPAGISTNECHALEAIEFFDTREPAAVTVVAGDLNAEPDQPTVAHLLEAGFVDAWLASGNPECDPATHVGCTGGGDQPEPFVGMNTPEGPGFDERIDYVLVRPGGGCAIDALEVEAEGFAAEARRDSLNGMWWPADHAGVLAEVRCA